jgi:DNA-binding transcriptional LysR family regulator
VFLRRAVALLADAGRLRQALNDYEGLQSGKLSIGVGPYPLEISVLESVARLASRHPSLYIELLEGQWREFGPKILSGEIEIAVVDASIVVSDPRFQIELLAKHEGCLFCRPGHPLSGRRKISLSQVLDYPLVSVRIPFRAESLLKPGSHGLPRDPATGDLIPRITTTSMTASCAIIKRTDGIGLGAIEQIADAGRAGVRDDAQGCRGRARGARGRPDSAPAKTPQTGQKSGELARGRRRAPLQARIELLHFSQRTVTLMHWTHG